MRTPDWYRRLRALERRIDNQSTDIARLWNWAPQMPEQPGHFMPQIVPGTTAPPSTTTTTSTSTTSTTTTSGPTTTYTTTTIPPLSCKKTWPSTLTVSSSGFSGAYGWMNGTAPVGINGVHTMYPWNCGLVEDDGVNGFGYLMQYFTPSFTDPSSYGFAIGWKIWVIIRASGYSSLPTWFSDPAAEYDSISIFLFANNATLGPAEYSKPQNIGPGPALLVDPLTPALVGDASGLCGRSFSLQVRSGFTFNSNWETHPSTVSIQFGPTPIP